MPIAKKKLKRPAGSVSRRRDDEAKGPTRHPQLEAMYRDLTALRNAGLDNRNRFLELEAAVLLYCKEHNIHTYDQHGVKFSAVRPEGEEIDWATAKAILGPKRWAAILDEPQPSRQKLTAMCELDAELAKQIVTEAVTPKPIKHSVRFGS